VPVLRVLSGVGRGRLPEVSRVVCRVPLPGWAFRFVVVGLCWSAWVGECGEAGEGGLDEGDPGGVSREP